MRDLLDNVSEQLQCFYRLGAIKLSHPQPFQNQQGQTYPMYQALLTVLLIRCKTATLDLAVTFASKEHRHSGTKFITPDQRQKGEETKILIENQKLHVAMRRKNQSRWSQNTRDWTEQLRRNSQ